MESMNAKEQEAQGLERVVDLLAAEQAVLERARTVSQSILDRVREVTGDTNETAPLSPDSATDTSSR